MSHQWSVIDQSAAGYLFGRGRKDNKQSEDVLILHERIAALELALGKLQQHNSHLSESLTEVKHNLHETDGNVHTMGVKLKMTDMNVDQYDLKLSMTTKRVEQNSTTIHNIANAIQNIVKVIER